MADDPSISVVVICFNQAQYIRSAVESVLCQTRIDRIGEVIVVDDGSTDSSRAVIDSLAEESTLVRPIVQANSGGASRPRNVGIKAARGDYVAFLDGDDLWMPDKVETELENIANFKSAGLLYGDYIEFDESSGTETAQEVNIFSATDPRALEKLFVDGGPILPSATIVSRDAFERVGLFDEALSFNEEADMWLRIAAEFPIQHIPKAQIRKRTWYGSLGSLKYARESIAVHHQITDRMLALRPELGRVANHRRARIALKEGIFHLRSGRRWAAVRSFVSSVSMKPLSIRPWVYLGAAIVPGKRDRLIQYLKRGVGSLKSRSAASRLVGRA